MVQWLLLSAFTSRSWVQSLVRKLRSHKLSSMVKKRREQREPKGFRDHHQVDQYTSKHPEVKEKKEAVFIWVNNDPKHPSSEEEN